MIPNSPFTIRYSLFTACPHFPGGVLHGVDDVLIPRTAAQVPLQGAADLGLGRPRITQKELVRGEDHAGRAVTALKPVTFPKALLQRMELLASAESLNGQDFCAVGLDGQDRARLNRLPVQHHGAGAADARLTANVGARQADYVAKIVDQKQARFDFVAIGRAVDPQSNLPFGRQFSSLARPFAIFSIYTPMRLRRSSALPLSFLIVVAFDSSHVLAQPVKLKTSPTLAIADMGQWKVIQKGVEFRKLTLERSEPYQVIDLKMLRFDTRHFVPQIVYSLRYNLKAADVKTLAEKCGASAVINASYFDEKAKPLGFLKVAAGEVNPGISKSSLFTGVFTIKDRLPFITHRDQFLSQQADEGLQAGPLLLLRGTALHITRGAGRQSRRALIGIDKDQRLIVAVTDSLLGGLNWAEVQEIFASDAWQVRAADLLNLDGGGSAQLYVKARHFEEHVPGTTEVPVAIGFFPKGN